MRDGNLDRLHIQFLSKVQRPLDCFFRFTRQANDEISMNLDPDLLAILRELTRMFDRRAFLDVFQDLRITGFISDNEETRARIGHCLQRFIVAGHARRARPTKS